MARILVIDDELGTRKMLEQVLTAAGHEVLLAAHGKEGIHQQRANHADVAIMDVFMPEKDGLETITVFRRDFPKVPIIAMSGYGSSGAMLSMAKELGATRILDKPFAAETILTLIEDVLRKKVIPD